MEYFDTAGDFDRYMDRIATAMETQARIAQENQQIAKRQLEIAEDAYKLQRKLVTQSCELHRQLGMD